MSTLASKSGTMLTAASVTMSGSLWRGTSMMKQWLIRRSVRVKQGNFLVLGLILPNWRRISEQFQDVATEFAFDSSIRNRETIRTNRELSSREQGIRGAAQANVSQVPMMRGAAPNVL